MNADMKWVKDHIEYDGEIQIDYLPLELESLKDKILILKLGNNEYPATQSDIDHAISSLKDFFKGLNCKPPHIIVTHHLFDISLKTLTEIEEQTGA